ncbi:hypothetical protein D3C73_1408080 [compost metagenome]
MDKSFTEFKPKHPRDEIKSFTYCSPRIYQEWQLKIEREKGGQTDATGTEHFRPTIVNQYYANDAEGTTGTSLQSAANSGSATSNSQFDLDQFVRR